MAQLSLDFPQNKNGNARHGRPDERKLAADLKGWLSELDAAEALRREQLQHIAKLRSEIYQHAKARGITANTLRVARRLMRK